MSRLNVIDNIVRVFSPKAAYERETYRQAHEQMRSYDAGSDDRLNAGWRARNESGVLEDRFQRSTIRARARDLERNSDIMGGILTAYERNVIGNGFRLQAKTDDNALNEHIEVLWNEWCRARNCDVSGEQSFWELCRMALRRKKVDGGFLLVKRHTRDGVVPFKLQCLDMDELDTFTAAPKNAGHRVVDGVEVDGRGRHVGYWIRQYSLDGMTQASSIFVDAKDVIFYWTRKRPSQVREVSELAATLTRIRDIDSFMVSVSTKERMAANFGIVIKRMNPPGAALGRGAMQTGSKKGAYKGKAVEPGMIMELEPGDDVTPVQPAGQGGSASDFVRLQQRLAGAGVGLGYETMARDMSQVNYSSARQGLIEDNMTYAIERQNLIDHVLDEIYETFLISCVVSGALDIPGFWEKKRDVMRHTWTPPAKPWIDPLKEANANKVALENGMKTIQQIAAENGKDWREQLEEIAEAARYAAELGIELGGATTNG